MYNKYAYLAPDLDGKGPKNCQSPFATVASSFVTTASSSPTGGGGGGVFLSRHCPYTSLAASSTTLVTSPSSAQRNSD